MEKEELSIQGHRYFGRFSAVKKTKEFWAGSEYTEHLEDRYWFEGIGIIEDIEKREPCRFLFKTEIDRYGKESKLIEKLLVIEDKNYYRRNPPVIKKEFVNDLILEKIYQDAKEKEKTEIIPEVYSSLLSYEELLEKGLIADEKSGQIMLALTS